MFVIKKCIAFSLLLGFGGLLALLLRFSISSFQSLDHLPETSASKNSKPKLANDPLLSEDVHALSRTTPAAGRKESSSRGLVIPRLMQDNMAWLDETVADLAVTTYVADNISAPLHPPMNKGHEVMTYLSYIIDHYDRLPGIILFMHSHHHAIHNSDVFDLDALQMIQHLQDDHVHRQGYFNMRCNWSPGCPEWLDPTVEQETLSKQEQAVLAQSWRELFPTAALPARLGQACCAQFAVSRARILSIPRSRFVFYRDWLLKTPLSDYISGRIWEYSWQYVFARGRETYCPAEHVCYCDGYGVCFEGEGDYRRFAEVIERRKEYRKRLGIVREDPADGSNGDERSSSYSVEQDVSLLEEQIAQLDQQIIRQRAEALQHGMDLKSQRNRLRI